MLRPYMKSDKDMLTDMLKNEGLESSDMGFEDHYTFILDDGKGFFTFRFEHDMPYLVHFCTNRKYRSISLARRLIKSFIGLMKENGYHKAILQIPCKKPDVMKIMRYYFKKDFYASKEEHYFMLVEV